MSLAVSAAGNRLTPVLFSFVIALCQLENNVTPSCDIVARACKENREIRYFIEVGMVFA